MISKEISRRARGPEAPGKKSWQSGTVVEKSRICEGSHGGLLERHRIAKSVQALLQGKENKKTPASKEGIDKRWPRGKTGRPCNNE